MINRDEFIEIIDKLREVDDFVKETNNKARELKDAIISDFFNASSLSISHEDIVVKLLENMFNGTDMISWWLYELDYGREYKRGCIKDCNGKNIDVSDAGKLYAYLIKEYCINEKEKER